MQFEGQHELTTILLLHTNPLNLFPITGRHFNIGSCSLLSVKHAFRMRVKTVDKVMNLSTLIISYVQDMAVSSVISTCLYTCMRAVFMSAV